MTLLARLGLIALLMLAAALPARAQGSDPSFTLVNRGTQPLRELYVTPAGDPDWGRNRLDRGTLPPGGRFEVQRRRDGNCVMDIRAVFAGGHSEERRGLNTCAIDAVAVGEPAGQKAKPSDDPSIRLVNRGKQAIAEFYASPAGSGSWGDNRLTQGPLPPATEKLVRIAPTGACLFDLRVVFADRNAVEKKRADLCRITDLPVP